jgi:hypothetical protein
MKKERKMNTYRVELGSSTNIIHDVFIVRAKDCAQAEKMVLKQAGDDYSDDAHVVKIEELSGEFIEQ